MVRGSRRQRGTVLPLPPAAVAVVTTKLAKRVIVAAAALTFLVSPGRSTIFRIPPRAHTQVRAPLVVARTATPPAGKAVVFKAPPKHAVGLKPIVAQRTFDPRFSRSVILPIPPKHAVGLRPIVSVGTPYQRGRSIVLPVPPRAHTQVRPAIVTGRVVTPVGRAAILRLPYKTSAVPTSKAVPRALLARVRPDAPRGSAAVYAAPVPLLLTSYNGGPGVKNFADSSQLGGGTVGVGRTYIGFEYGTRLLQNGDIAVIRYQMHASLPSGIKLKAFRPNGTNFDFVCESEKFTPIAGGAFQTRTLTTPLVGVRPGDLLGIWTDSDGATNQVSVVASGFGANAVVWLPGDITGANQAFSNGVTNFNLNLEAFGIAPVAAMTGDSIEVGHNNVDATKNNNSFLDGNGPAGNPVGELGYQMRNALGPGFTYQDYAAGSKDWSWTRLTAIPAILAGTGVHASRGVGMSEIWIHCGVNDIAAGRTWASVQADLDAIYAATSCPIFIDEVTPWGTASTGSDANAITTRTFNANYATWAAGKSRVRIVPVWAALGALRVSTGQNDNLNSLYDSGDGIHLNATGAAIVASIRAGVRNAYYGASARAASPVLQIAPRLSYVRGSAIVERIPIRTSATPTTRAVTRYLIVSRKVDHRGVSVLWRVPPRVRPPVRYMVTARSTVHRGTATVQRAPARRVATRPLSPFVFRGRVDLVQGRALVVARPVPHVTVTHPIILLPTSAILENDGITRALLASNLTSVLLANDGVTSVILVGS